MSLIARCPACLTWYKVVPDQLRISDGWVRCGTCGEVFDVSRQLIEAESELPTDQAPTNVQEFPPQQVAADAALRDAPTPLPEPMTVERLPSHGDEALVMPAATEDFLPDSQTEAKAEVPWDSAALLIKPSVETEAEAGPQIGYEPEPEVAKPVAVAPVPVPVPLAEPVSFMGATVVRPALHRNSKSLLWAVLCVLLLLGLLVQGLYRERDQLAALKPEF
ncbi:MAG TPA: zinc-ribbon domain-containing protein, partial [Rhodoferax sp.]|nr:zinc-ribbon domain-containing protein [Rhodoferax sp.]